MLTYHKCLFCWNCESVLFTFRSIIFYWWYEFYSLILHFFFYSFLCVLLYTSRVLDCAPWIFLNEIILLLKKGKKKKKEIVNNVLLVFLVIAICLKDSNMLVRMSCWWNGVLGPKSFVFFMRITCNICNPFSPTWWLICAL